MGFYRQGQPEPPVLFDRAAVRAAVTPFVAEEIAFLSRTADPFGVDNDCPNLAGHRFAGSCGDIVCVYCGKVAWS